MKTTTTHKEIFPVGYQGQYVAHVRVTSGTSTLGTFQKRCKSRKAAQIKVASLLRRFASRGLDVAKKSF